MTKTQLKTLIANDDLDKVIQGLIRHADQYDLPEVRSDAIIQSGKLEEYKKQLRTGVATHDALAPLRTAVQRALLGAIDNLPDKPATTGKQRGISERCFKRSLFWLILFGQIFVLLWLWFQVDTGGFSPKELAATISVLLAVFTTYFMPMFQDMLKSQYIHPAELQFSTKRISLELALFTWLMILFGYFGLMFYFIHLRGCGKWGFDDFTTGLALLSTGLGVYVAALINTVFKKSEAN